MTGPFKRRPLTADDDRHGTYAGYSAHKRDSVPMCDPCRIARNERRAEQREKVGRPDVTYCVDCGQRTASRDRICRECQKRHKVTGWSPDDALVGGRWVPTGGIMRWVASSPQGVVATVSFTTPGRYDGGTNQDGPRPAALTAGSSRGLARRYEGAPN